jgi:cold-inducible RNA-binding protein
MRIYVGNLSFQTSDRDLEEAFSSYGTVESVTIIMDRDSGRSKGFGFVEMNDAGEAANAISSLNGQELAERALTVNEAKPREDRARGDAARGPRRW